MYVVRKATSPVALQTYVLSFLVVQLLRFVSMPHVLANMPSLFEPVAFAQFHAISFLNTEPIVQLFAVGTISLSAWLVRGIVRNTKAVLVAGKRPGLQNA